MRSPFLLALLSALLTLPLVSAQEPTLAEPLPGEPPMVEPTPAAEITCCPIQVSRHRVTLSAKRAYRCQSTVPVTLCVQNPADCCYYAVELCVPCCCVGEAKLCSADCGLLGRGVVTYAWDCGLCAKIVFRPGACDAVVSYSM